MLKEHLTEGSGRENERKWKGRRKEVNLSKPSTPLHFFLEFLDDYLIKMIFYQSNLSSIQKNKPASIIKDEIKVFLGINMLMLVHLLPCETNKKCYV